MTRNQIWKTFQVTDSRCNTPFGWTTHLKVMRRDGKDGITWDQLQAIKNEYLGEDAWAIEVFPPNHAFVNEVNMRHLWLIPQENCPNLLDRTSR
jgi:hypothetical protein